MAFPDEKKEEEPAEPLEARPFVGYQPAPGETPQRWFPEKRPEGVYEVEEYPGSQFRARPAEPIAQTLGDVVTPDVLNKVFWNQPERPWHPGSQMGGGYTNEDIMNDAWRPSDRPTVRQVQASGVLGLTREQADAMRAAPYPTSVDVNDPEAKWRYDFWKVHHRLPEAADLVEREWMASFGQRYGRSPQPREIIARRKTGQAPASGLQHRYAAWDFAPNSPPEYIQHLILQNFGGELTMPGAPQQAPAYPGAVNYTRPAAGAAGYQVNRQGTPVAGVFSEYTGIGETPTVGVGPSGAGPFGTESFVENPPAAYSTPEQWREATRVRAGAAAVEAGRQPEEPTLLAYLTPKQMLEAREATGRVRQEQKSREAAEQVAAARAGQVASWQVTPPPVSRAQGRPGAVGAQTPRATAPRDLIGLQAQDWWNTILASVQNLGPRSPWYTEYLRMLQATPVPQLGI